MSQALREQSEGIAQVNAAVGHMDSATQENAALVQQASRAASALSERAQDLEQAVGAFKLDDEPESAAGAGFSAAQAKPALAPSVAVASAASSPSSPRPQQRAPTPAARSLQSLELAQH